MRTARCVEVELSHESLVLVLTVRPEVTVVF